MMHKSTEKRLEGGVTQLAAFKLVGRLKRFHAVQHQQGALSADEPSNSFSLIPSRAGSRIRLSEEAQCCINKGIGGRCFFAHALTEEGPANYPRGNSIIVVRHFTKPVVDERRFADAAMRGERKNAG